MIDAKLQRLKIQPSAPVDDAEFLRRVVARPDRPAADAGRGPRVPRGRRRRPSARAKIDKLIASPAFVDHWTLKWGDLLQNNRKYLGEKGACEFREWIRDSIAAEQAVRPDGARDAHRARQLLRQSGGEFLPRHARPQADDGEDHAGLPRRPHGLRAVPRPSVRALDAEPVLPDGRVLLGRSASRPGTRWARRSSTTSGRTST